MFESVKASTRGTADALVLGVFKTDKGASIDGASLEHDPDGSVKAACGRAECTGEAGSIAEAFPSGVYKRVLLVGLGKEDEADMDALRSAAAAVLRRLAQTRDENVAVELGGALKRAKIDAHAAGRAFGEAASLLTFTFQPFKGSGSGDAPKRPRLSLRSGDSGFATGLKTGIGLGASANVSRDASATPPNVATPEWMAQRAQELARGFDSISVRVIKGAALEKEKLTGLINVGQASANPPCLIRIEYTPARAKKGAKPAVLVGKTITYDTGGLSLKPPTGMAGMKHDKNGGCAVLGAMHAVASVVKPGVPVVALLAAAENCVSDNAYRPDDVITFRNGVTVEVTNTDAEGRLVLADALCWACDKEKPAYIVDFATLTGGVVVALGATYAGLWCDDDDLRGRIEAASADSGERVWRLPLHREYREMMKSDVADIVNSNPNRKAHPIQGAAFLSHFVEKGIPWAHVDVAGVSDVESETGPYIKGSATGFGVRLVASLLS